MHTVVDLVWEGDLGLLLRSDASRPNLQSDWDALHCKLRNLQESAAGPSPAPCFVLLGGKTCRCSQPEVRHLGAAPPELLGALERLEAQRCCQAGRNGNGRPWRIRLPAEALKLCGEP